jgi:hypothetical protein
LAQIIAKAIIQAVIPAVLGVGPNYGHVKITDDQFKVVVSLAVMALGFGFQLLYSVKIEK